MTKEQYYESGMEFFSGNDLEKPIEQLGKALAEDPHYGDALHALAMSYYHLGDIDRAIKYGEQLRHSEAHNVHAYTGLSLFYNAKGLVEQAEEMGARATELAADED